ncbi:MAG: sigma-70 family RNA polymerase sigma factor [Firmicutes bacterium]|nr:sigma-70 family RNA polymerase sigma factor [Bacillota bacterium]
MKESPQDTSPLPRGEEEKKEYTRMLPQLRQIAQHALRRTQRWKTPPGYETAYWREECESIASMAVWNAFLSYKPNANVSFPVYAFLRAVQAIRQEHRLAWRWSVSTTPLRCDGDTGEPIEPVDPEWQKPFQQCEDRCDLQTLLRSLSDQERQLILWHYQEELTEREIAQRLNLSKTAVHKRLTRVRTKLEKALAEKARSG